MTTISGTLEVNNNPYNRAEIHQKTDQNQLKGVFYHTAGNALSLGAVGVTGLSAVVIADKILKGAFLSAGTAASLPSVPVLVGAAVVLDILVVKLAADCIDKANYHLGPEVEVRYTPDKLHQYNYSIV